MLYQDFHLKPSRQFIVLIVIVSVGAIVAAEVLPLSIGIKWLLVWIAGIYGGWIVWRYGLLKSKHALITLRYYTNGCWQVRQSWQSLRNADLLGDSVVTAYVSVLRFTLVESGQTISCVIFRDALAKDVYRQLIVKARFCI